MILACLSILHITGAQAQAAGSIEQNFAGSLTTVPAENPAVSAAFYVPVYSSVSMIKGKLRLCRQWTLGLHHPGAADQDRRQEPTKGFSSEVGTRFA
jgi:hypothetical protein